MAKNYKSPYLALEASTIYEAHEDGRTTASHPKVMSGEGPATFPPTLNWTRKKRSALSLAGASGCARRARRGRPSIVDRHPAPR